MDVDLDIDNYDLMDILNLFKLKYNFDKNDLKQAKLMALKTHPDKSKLDMKYFLFFSKAYNIVLKIYKFRNKKFQNAEKKEYIKTEMEDNEKKNLMMKLNKFKNANEFNVWFNDVFEKIKVKNEEMDSGYGNWFTSDEDINNETAKNMSEFKEIFEKKKQSCKSLVKYNGIQEMYNNNGSNLTNKRPQLYQSDVFSKLKFEDLKQAHTVTVVPVTNDDIDWSKKTDSLENYKKQRLISTKEGPSSLEQSKKYLNSIKEREEVVNTRRAYNLYKKDEEIEQSNNKFWSFLKQLDN
jgi:hypothetical protein